MHNLIPKPVSIEVGAGTFTIAPGAKIYLSPATPALHAIAAYLADKIKHTAGLELEVLPTGAEPPAGNLLLSTQEGDPALGDEGYTLTIAPAQVTLRAHRPAGVFYGVQTLLQMLPPAPTSASAALPAGTIRDLPRFAWRGAMLDVARHFFGVAEVKRFIDLMALYKMNRLHLHLSDDQGWRVMIETWPELARRGGHTSVGGGPGGAYTQQEYADLDGYAQSRFVTLVPEIDMPGHTNAALASYPELNRDRLAPDLYTGAEVGFSSLCVDKEITYWFVEDVVNELAALTSGPYFHIGGDEAHSTKGADYVRFVEKAQQIVAAQGKQMIGWDEIAQAALRPDTIVQHWFSPGAQQAAQRGARVIMSPATKAYLDMKYDAACPLGLNWAGFVDVQTSYAWDPVQMLGEAPARALLGVEAPLWSETLLTMADVEYMAFPRLLGIAEIGWSPAAGRDWPEYRLRLAAHGPRLAGLGVNFYRAPEVPWED